MALDCAVVEAVAKDRVMKCLRILIIGLFLSHLSLSEAFAEHSGFGGTRPGSAGYPSTTNINGLADPCDPRNFEGTPANPIPPSEPRDTLPPGDDVSLEPPVGNAGALESGLSKCTTCHGFQKGGVVVRNGGGEAGPANVENIGTRINEMNTRLGANALTPEERAAILSWQP